MHGILHGRGPHFFGRAGCKRGCHCPLLWHPRPQAGQGTAAKEPPPPPGTRPPRGPVLCLTQKDPLLTSQLPRPSPLPPLPSPQPFCALCSASCSSLLVRGQPLLLASSTFRELEFKCSSRQAGLHSSGKTKCCCFYTHQGRGCRSVMKDPFDT